MGWISRRRELTPAEVKAVREEAKRPLKTRGEQSRKS